MAHYKHRQCDICGSKCKDATLTGGLRYCDDCLRKQMDALDEEYMRDRIRVLKAGLYPSVTGGDLMFHITKEN